MKNDETFINMALSISKDYEAIHYIDLASTHYTSFFPMNNEKNWHKSSDRSNFWEDAIAFFNSRVYEEDLEGLLSCFKEEIILKALEEDYSYSLTFRVKKEKEPTYYRIKVFNSPEEETPHLIACIKDVHKEMLRYKELRAKKREASTYFCLASTLASRYYQIFYVDVNNHTYSTLYNTATDIDLGLTFDEKDFWEDVIINSEKIVYHEDINIFRETLKKENLINELEKNGAASLTYRLVLGEQPMYMSLRALYGRNDKNHIIVGVENIDAQIKKENEYKYLLGMALNQANRDELTGVKNMHAFKEYEDTLQLEIDSSEEPKFAVVMCDINNLKQINDTQGHEKGDEAIREGCRAICRTFAHSPVFRVGGDEFVAVLRNTDYQNRNTLLKTFKREMIDSLNKKGVVVAIGMSDYKANEDKLVKEVLARADSSMYANKKQLKDL
ncbi:MAG: GGDEF domain-containing protein [Lachnospiraceae bacterium]|nr:GGDEF domain-containing protein [Lachnospiraceae bacterium]